MKTVTIVRHASAVGHEAELKDFERSLTKEGIKEAKNVASELKALGLKPNLIISSPAIRAIQTAETFAKTFGYRRKKIALVDALYEDLAPEKVLEIFNGLDDSSDSVMVFGHDPVLSTFVKYFVKDFSEEMPKGSVVSIESNRKIWKNLSQQDGNLKFFAFPNKQAASSKKGEIKKEVIAIIDKQLNETASELGIALDKKTKKLIKNLSGEFAKKAAKEIKKQSKLNQVSVIQGKPAAASKAKPAASKTAQKPVVKKTPSAARATKGKMSSTLPKKS